MRCIKSSNVSRMFTACNSTNCVIRELLLAFLLEKVIAAKVGSSQPEIYLTCMQCSGVSMTFGWRCIWTETEVLIAQLFAFVIDLGPRNDDRIEYVSASHMSVDIVCTTHCFKAATKSFLSPHRRGT
eukprot:scaffold83970_cov35-Prasinocladus_malaysianus.AAC.4